LKLLWQDHAKAEFREALQYYLDHAGETVTQDFRQEIQRVIRQLREHPESGMRIRHEARRFPVHDFPFHVIYRVAPDALIVVALAHQSRRPGYWAGRR